MSLRVLLAIPQLDRGGPDRVFADLLHHFNRHDICPGLFVISGRGYHFERLPPDVPVLVNGAHHPLYEKYPVVGLVKAVRSFRPDVLMTTLRMVTTASAARPFIGDVVHVARVANQVSDQLRDLSRTSQARAFAIQHLVRISLQRADHVVSQSRRMAEDLGRIGCTTPVTVIGNGIDPSMIDAPTGAAASPLRGAPRLLFVGRLAPQKGVDILIEAFRIVATSSAEAVLTIVGDGPQRSALGAQVAAAGLQDRVDFVGQQTDPFPFLRHADLVVAPSRYEGFSNTILEALASGTPVVATADAGANDEVVRPPFNGQLAPTAQPSLVAQAILRQLRQTPPQRERITRDVANRYSSGTIAREYESLAHAVRERRSAQRRRSERLVPVETRGR